MGILVNNANWWPSIWTPGDFQTLFKLMLPEEDFAKRTAYYKQLNKMAIDDYAVFCPIHPKFNFKAASPKLIDMGMGNLANEFLPEIIWLKK
jgi:hypothetical protein